MGKKEKARRARVARQQDRALAHASVKPPKALLKEMGGWNLNSTIAFSAIDSLYFGTHHSWVLATLKKLSIGTVAQLMLYTEAKLRSMDRIGPKTIAAIVTGLAQHKLRLRAG